MLITNARIVRPDEIVLGTVHIVAGRISDVQPGHSRLPAADDWQGDLLLPGLVEMHTDNLEQHMAPRPGVDWPVLSALASHDAQMATAGITTVLDAMTVGDPNEQGVRRRLLPQAVAAINRAREEHLTRAEHLLHLRCEMASDSVVADVRPYLDNPHVRLVSVMDHTPGQRQWRDLGKYRQYYQGKNHWSDEKAEQMVHLQKALQREHAAVNRRTVVALARERGLPLASHDDTTEENVRSAVDDGMAISEFPTTALAAGLARALGMAIIGGAPNLVRGGSHSGNVSVGELAAAGQLDALSSDYMPASLLMGAFHLHEAQGWPLPRAVRTVTANPAAMIGLTDRGAIVRGLRADLIRVQDAGHLQRVLAVYRQGARVA